MSANREEIIKKLVVAVLVNVNGWEREEAERVALDERGSDLWDEFEGVLSEGNVFSKEDMQKAFDEGTNEGTLRQMYSDSGDSSGFHESDLEDYMEKW